MFIDIEQLESEPLDFDQEYAPGLIDFGPDLQQKSPLHAAGRAQLVEEILSKHRKIQDIRLHGALDATFELPCARCLEVVSYDVKRPFDLLYRPQGTDSG